MCKFNLLKAKGMDKDLLKKNIYAFINKTCTAALYLRKLL